MQIVAFSFKFHSPKSLTDNKSALVQVKAEHQASNRCQAITWTNADLD